MISFEQGNFFLSDNNSKFGTLVLMKEEFELEFNKEISIQIGKTVMNFHVKNPNLKIKIPKRFVFICFLVNLFIGFL